MSKLISVPIVKVGTDLVQSVAKIPTSGEPHQSACCREGRIKPFQSWWK